MSLSSGRQRAYSKATKEELLQLNLHLSQKGASELNQIIQAAVNASSEVANVLIRMLKDISARKPLQSQPIQSSHVQPGMFAFGNHESQLCTPPDSAEDSEMSGTDSSSHKSTSDTFLFSSAHHSESTSSSAADRISSRPAKRKYLVDRDDNVPNVKTFSKKRKSVDHPPDASYSIFHDNSTIPSQKHQCVNCNRHVDGHEWDNLHGCIHHPGYLTAADVWSCCQSQSLVRGCLVSKHSEVSLAKINPEFTKTVQK